MSFRVLRSRWAGWGNDRRDSLRVRFILGAIVLCCLPLAGAAAKDGPSVLVRVGNHPGYGRVVFDLPARTNYQLTQQGEHVSLQFTGDLTVGSSTVVPHNVLGVTGGASQAEIVIAPGTVVRESHFGDRLVIDVWDEAAAPKMHPATSDSPRQGAATVRPMLRRRPPRMPFPRQRVRRRSARVRLRRCALRCLRRRPPPRCRSFYLRRLLHCSNRASRARSRPLRERNQRAR